jgi:hypothetical protein
MGWWGYNILDGDSVMDFQTKIIETIVGKKNGSVFLENGKTISTMDFDSIQKLDPKTLNYIDDNYEKLVFDLKLNNNVKRSWEETDRALEWQVLADFYMKQDLDMPPELIEKAIEATNFLKGEHALSFTNPKARLKVLDNFLKRINTYKPKHIKTKEEIIQQILLKNPNHSKYFKKTVTLLFNNGLKTIQALTDHEKFEAPNYFNIPKSITSNLNKKEITTISEICNNELSTFFRAETHEYSKVYTDLKEAQKNLNNAQTVFINTTLKLK